MTGQARSRPAHQGKGSAGAGRLPHLSRTRSLLLVTSRHIGWVVLRSFLQDKGQWRVVADVSRPEAAQDAARTYQPATVLLAANVGDVPLSVMVARLHEVSPESNILVLSDEGEIPRSVLTEPGVAGYLCWGNITEESIEAGLAAAETGWWIGSRSAVVDVFSRHVPEKREGRVKPRLSAREEAVLLAQMDGRSEKEIAQEQHISVRTVEATVHVLKRKFDSRTTGEVCTKAQSLGFSE